MGYKTTAEKAFEQKTSIILTPEVSYHPWPGEGPLMIADDNDPSPNGHGTIVPTYNLYLEDMIEIERTFAQYGSYLELIGGDTPHEHKIVILAGHGEFGELQMTVETFDEKGDQ